MTLFSSLIWIPILRLIDLLLDAVASLFARISAAPRGAVAVTPSSLAGRSCHHWIARATTIVVERPAREVVAVDRVLASVVVVRTQLSRVSRTYVMSASWWVAPAGSPAGIGVGA